jgi:hypothetical protein
VFQLVFSVKRTGHMSWQVMMSWSRKRKTLRLIDSLEMRYGLFWERSTRACLVPKYFAKKQ